MKRYFMIVAFVLSSSSFAWCVEKLEIDPATSVVEFSVSNFGVNTVRGHFKRWKGHVLYNAGDLTKSTVHVELEAASIDTGNEKRDHHLRSPDFFDAAKFPLLTFDSKSIVLVDGRYVMAGDLTIHGVTQSTPVYFTMVQSSESDQGSTLLRASGKAILDRRDFEIRYGNSFSVGNKVTIVLEISAGAKRKTP